MKSDVPRRNWRWIIAGLLLSIPALAFAWLGNQDYPKTFPPEVEALDRTLYVHGGHRLFPERYAQFHQQLLDTRNTWRTTMNQWWATKDGEGFQQRYQALLEEGTILLEAVRQKSLALRMEIEDRMRPEQDQVARLRSLTHLFEMGPDARALSKAEGLLNEAATRLETGQFAKARLAIEEAILSMQDVESHLLDQMRRYSETEQLAVWNQWVTHTIRWSTITGGTAIIVLKAPKRLQVYRQGRVLAEYPIDLGFSGLLDKQYEGDGSTPEGRFHIIRKKGEGETQFHRALLLDYPSADHKRRFQERQAMGEIPEDKTIGGAIEIHGKPINAEGQTSGCVAVENEAMDHLFQVMTVGGPVTIIGALDTNNDVVDMFHALEDHIQQRTTKQQEPTTLSAVLNTAP